MIDEESVNEIQSQGAGDITGVNSMLGNMIQNSLRVHLLRITNSTVVGDIVKSVRALKRGRGNPVPTESTSKTEVDSAHISKTRKRRIPPPENSVIFNLNCDPEVASRDFLAEVHKSNDTQEAFKRCRKSNIPKTWLHFIARLVWLDVVIAPVFDFERDHDLLVAQREDFDLKANALK